MTTKIDDFSEGTGDDVPEQHLTDLLLKISPLLLLTLAQKKKKKGKEFVHRHDHTQKWQTRPSNVSPSLFFPCDQIKLLRLSLVNPDSV